MFEVEGFTRKIYKITALRMTILFEVEGFPRKIYIVTVSRMTILWGGKKHPRRVYVDRRPSSKSATVLGLARDDGVSVFFVWKPAPRRRLKNDGSSAGRFFSFDQAEHQLGSALANHLAVLINARKRNPKPMVTGLIAAADQSNLFRNPQARFSILFIAPIASGSLKQKTPSGFGSRASRRRMAFAP